MSSGESNLEEHCSPNYTHGRPDGLSREVFVELGSCPGYSGSRNNDFLAGGRFLASFERDLQIETPVTYDGASPVAFLVH